MKKVFLTLIAFISVSVGLYLMAAPDFIKNYTNSISSALEVQEPAVQLTTSARSIPFYEDFAGDTVLSGWTVNNHNADASTWAYRAHGGWDESSCAAYFYSTEDGDDWLFSPALSLEANKEYQLEFFTDFIYEIQSLKLTVGSSTAIADHTQEIYDIPSVGEDNYEAVNFTVPTDGDYHIGFYCYSAGGAYSYLYLDEVKVSVAALRDAPAPVSDLSPVPGAAGVESMSLTWMNPDTCYGGEALTSISSIQIYKDDAATPVQYAGDLTPGASASWTDENPEAGEHNYRIVATNSAGSGLAREVQTFVGIDLPQGPGQVEASETDGVISLSWNNPPALGQKGGWYDATTLSYRILRKPDNLVLETAYEGYSYTDASVSSLANYTYEITTKNANGTGGTTVSNIVQAGETVALPFHEDWEDENSYGLWTIANENDDAYTWAINYIRGNEAPSCMGIVTLSTAPNGDDWFFTPPMQLTEGETYRVKYALRTAIYADEDYSITLGKTAVPAAHSNVISAVEEANTSNLFAVYSTTFEPTYTGTFNVGFHLSSTGGSDIYFDDITVEKVVSSDLTVVDIKGNTAPTVGEAVSHTITIKNNGTAALGNYTVQVLNADDEVLASYENSRTLASGSTKEFDLEWIPTVAGYYPVKANIVCEADMALGNNQSDFYPLNVQTQDQYVITVGEGEDVEYTLPIYAYGFYVFSESVYPASYFEGHLGMINAIAYKVICGATDLDNQPIQIYIGEIEENTLKNGWVSSADLQLVVDRKVDIPKGIYDWKLPFDTAYQYKGGNLVLLVRNSGAGGELGGHGLTFQTSTMYSASSRYMNTYVQLDPEEPLQTAGVFTDIIPNTMFYFDQSESGTLSGTVHFADSQEPVAGARMELEGISRTLLSDENGQYAFSNLQAGTYQLKASYLGYADEILELTVASGAEVNADFDLSGLAKVSITGQLTGSDDPELGLVNVSLILSGYAADTVQTDASGNYIFDPVFGNQTYQIRVETDGYEVFTDSIVLTDAALTDYDIELTQLAAQPLNVSGMDRNADAYVSWHTPVFPVQVTKANGLAYGIFGSNYSTIYSIGHRYTPKEFDSYGIKEGMCVTKIRFYAYAMATFTVKVWQGSTNEESTVYSQLVEPELGAWNEVTLNTSVPIDLSENLVIGVEVAQMAGVSPVAYDNQEAVSNGDAFYDGSDWTTAYLATDGTLNGNWCIEATCGVDANADPVVLTTSAKATNESALELASTFKVDSVQGFRVEELVTPDIKRAQLKTVNVQSSPLAYNVYRLLNGQEQEPESWVQVNTDAITDTFLVDDNWQVLENDIYRYAVKSIYTNNVQSLPTFSNGIDKGKYAVVDALLSTNGGSPEDAIVYLENNLFSYQASADAAGAVQLNDIYFGTYTLRIVKKGYQDFEQDSIVIDENTEDLGAFQILEDTRPARRLTVTDYIARAELAWEAPNDYTNSWLYKDDGTNVDGVGLVYGGTMAVGQRYTSEELQDMDVDGFVFSKIRIFPAAAGTFTLKIWSGSEGSEIVIYSEDVEVTVGEWNTFVLKEAVPIDVTQSYVIGYEATHEASVYPFGYDKGPRVEGGDAMIYGGAWYSFSEAMDNLYDFNWNVHAYCAFDTEEKQLALSQKTIASNLDDEAATVATYQKMALVNLLAVNPAKEKTETMLVEEDFAISYLVYRMLEEQVADSASWTLLTEEAVTTSTYSDASWESLPIDTFVYAVVAKYHGENYSQAAFSDAVIKGAVSLVDIEVQTNNNLQAENAEAVLSDADGLTFNTVLNANGEGQFVEVPKGTYSLKISLDGYESSSLSGIAISEDRELLDNISLNELVTEPVGLLAEIGNAGVELNWLAPGAYSPQDGWMYWDNGEASDAIGSSSGLVFSAAQRFTPDDLVDFRTKNLSLTKIAFYHSSSEDNPSEAYYQLRVWMGEDAVLVYQQDVDGVLDNAWNEIALDTAIYIDGTQELWVGYQCDDRSGYPAGVDNSSEVSDKGAKINIEDAWYNLSDVASIDANWSIHAYCEDVEDAKQVSLTAGAGWQPLLRAPDFDMQSIELGLKYETSGVHVKSVSQITDDKRFVLGYKLWRLPLGTEETESDWTLLTENMLTDTSLIDATWTEADGAVLYAVKAVYASGESEAVFSNEVGNATSLNTAQAEHALSIYPVPSKGTFFVEVDMEYTVLIRSLSGQVIYEGSLNEGQNQLTLQAMPGVYLLQLQNEQQRLIRKIILE